MPCDIQTFFEPATGTATHVVIDPLSRRCAVVDSVLDYDPQAGRLDTASARTVADWIGTQGLTVEWLLETHVHADHLSAAPWLRGRLGGRIAIGAHVTQVQRTFGALLNEPDVLACAEDPSHQPFQQLFGDGEIFHIGRLPVQVWHTPGHTPACVAYIVGAPDDPGGRDVFVGDTLFMPDYGSARCDFPGGSARALYRSVRRLLSLPPSTRLHLCHDYPPEGRGPRWTSTVADQRAHNVHLRDGIDEETFVHQRETRDAGLGAPRLFWPAIQVNVRAGHLPPPETGGRRFMKTPLEGDGEAMPRIMTSPRLPDRR